MGVLAQNAVRDEPVTLAGFAAAHQIAVQRAVTRSRGRIRTEIAQRGKQPAESVAPEYRSPGLIDLGPGGGRRSARRRERAGDISRERPPSRW